MSNLVTVKNSHRDHPDSGWLNKWKKYKGISEWADVTCANINCDNIAKHGGHVIRSADVSKKEYVVPLCVSCNETKNLEFDVNKEDMVLAIEL